MPVSIDLQNPCGFDVLPELAELQKWSSAALQSDNDLTVSVVVRVVDAEESASLNFNYRQKEGPTNVLSFPYDLPDFMAQLPELKEQAKHLGDLVLCEPIVRQEAQQQNKTLQQHWAHLIIHGVLHLQGYDHIDEEDAEEMEALEIKIMSQLGFENPY